MEEEGKIFIPIGVGGKGKKILYHGKLLKKTILFYLHRTFAKDFLKE
ncbi:MAG: hypothetical protein CM15mP123_13020 [Gammaproteobacteria bacterium]|nr:MAG: hypothetical protein CM15mP123_13020 [Gammaproteobacteria bacterium]